MPRKPKIVYEFKYYLDNVTKCYNIYCYNIYDSNYDIYWTGFESLDKLKDWIKDRGYILEGEL